MFKAEPIDNEEFGDLVEAGFDDLLIIIDGELYNLEDLHGCDCCEVVFADRADLDADSLCQVCAEEARLEREEVQSLRRWYQRMVL